MIWFELNNFCVLFDILLCASSVFMGASVPSQETNSESTLELLGKEAIRENGLSSADILAVSRASLSLQSSSGGGGTPMDSYTDKITLSHIEVRVLV